MLTPSGKEGPADIRVSVDGYRQSVLDAAKLKEQPKPLPKALTDEEEEEEEEEEYNEHHHSLADTVELFLTGEEEIKKAKQKF